MLAPEHEETIKKLAEWKALLAKPRRGHGSLTRLTFSEVARDGWPATITALEAALAEIEVLKAEATLGWHDHLEACHDV